MSEKFHESFRGAIKDKLMPALSTTRAAQKDHDERMQQLEKERKRELEEIKTRTMFNMVETIKLTINGQISDRKLVYLSHSQAFLFNSVSIEKLLGALEIKHEPQLCIRLLPSAFGLEFCSSQSRDRKVSGRHSNDESFIEHGARGCVHPPTRTHRELLESDARLLEFMKEVLIPLAISTNAVILMQGGSECDMAKACERACQPLFARYGKNFPFTIICVQSATAFGGIIAAADPTQYTGVTPDDQSRAKKSIAWQYLSTSKHSQNTKIKRAVQNRFGPNVGAWSAYDAVGWCTHYIMTESVVGETEEKYKRDSSDFNHINMLLSSYYAQNIPTICFTTFGINPSATFGRGGTRYAPHANLVRREIPIVFLDCRKRDVMIPETGYSSDHPLIKMLKAEGYFIQQENSIKEDDTMQPEQTKVITQEENKNRRVSLSKVMTTQNAIIDELRLEKHIEKQKNKKINEAMYKKSVLIRLALEDHTKLIDSLLSTHPVGGNTDVVLNDSWSNCTLAYFKMILDTDITSLPKLLDVSDDNGLDSDDTQAKNANHHHHHKHKPVQKKVTVTPLWEKIKNLQEDEMSNVEGMSKAEDELIDAVIDYLISEDIRQHWGSTAQADRDKIKNKFQIGSGHEFYQQAIRDKTNYWNDLFRSPYMKGASVYDLISVKNMVDMLTRADRLPKNNSYEALLIIRDAWCIYDLFAHTASNMKLRAKVSYALFLTNGLLLTATSVYGQDLKDALGYGHVENVVVLGKPFGVIGLTLFIFSLIGSIIAGYLAYVNPVRRWKELRLMSLHLKRDIWQFRTRSAKYSVDSTAGGGGFIASKRHAERILRERVMYFRRVCLEKADVQNFDMLKDPKVELFRHGQFAPPADFDLRRLSKAGLKVGEGILTKIYRLLCGKKIVGPTASYSSEVGHENDDFYSPVKPENYMEWRVIPLLNFYRSRLPLYASADNWSQALLGLNSITAAVFAYFEMVSAVAIVAQASSVQINFSEFNDIKKKLLRYNGIIAALENQILWWNSLTKVEKASQVNVNKLVNGVEETIAGEQQAWLAAYIKEEESKNTNHSDLRRRTAKVKPSGSKENK